jgi:hypothetical protein
MKTRSFLYLLTALIMVACQSTGVDKQDDGIKYKETVTINEVPKATLTFFEVSDSRCPDGVQCVWAGNATVDLALAGVTTEGGFTSHVSMCLGACDTKFKLADTLDYEFTGQKYRFILNAVTPVPVKDVTTPKEGYKISLLIQKK